MKTISKKTVFDNEDGDQLAARLDLPVTQPRAYALFAHCFTCSKDVAASGRISRELAANGWGVLRFDFTGLGSSEGDFENTNYSSNVEDLISAASFLRRDHDAPVLLIGHSLGGAAVLAAAADIPEVRSVVTIGAPGNPQHVSHLFGDSVEDIRKTGHAEVSIAGRSFRIKKHFLEDLDRQNAEERIQNLGKALLVLHSPADEIVGIENAREIYDTAKHPKSFISLDDADHLLSKKEYAAYAARVIAAWVSRYIDPAVPEPVTTESLPGGTIRLEEGEAKYLQRVRTADHQMIVDEPESIGGGNLAPGPYDYLLAALASCTSVTLRMYADRKGWHLEDIRMSASHRRIHAEDCADCETEDGRIDEIDIELEISGNLDEAQRARLHEIAQLCPVHKTLTSETKIRVNLATS
jgi:putative redox protein